MSSDIDLSKQQEAQQPPPMKKKSNSTWTGFISLLIIFHLPIILPLVYSVLTYPALYPFEQKTALRHHTLTNLLLPLAVIDIIGIITFFKKEPPPWIAFFVSLFAVDIVFFYLGCPNRLLSVDRFLDSRCHSRLSSV